MQVTLPAVPLQVRLLRDPFDWSRPKPPGPSKTPGKKRAIPLLPTTELAFSHDGHRLLARTEAGSVVAIPIRNSASASYGWPTPAELPLQTSLVAAVWGSRRARALVVAKGDGSIHLAAWDGSMGVPLVPSAPRPLPHELFIASWPARQGWQMRGTWFDAANTARVDASLLTARAFGSWVGRVIEGPRLESNASGHLRTLTLPLRPEKVWLSWEGPLAAACLHSDRLDVHFVVTNSDLSTQVHTRSLPRALFSRDDLIQGLYVGAGPKLEVTVIALQPDRRTVRSLNIFGVAPQWNEVTRPRNQLAAFALSPHGRYFAWRDVEGEIAVFSRDRGAVVLRLHTSNVAVERP